MGMLNVDDVVDDDVVVVGDVVDDVRLLVHWGRPYTSNTTTR